MPADKPNDGSALSDFQRRTFEHIDKWSDDGDDFTRDAAGGRASRGEPSVEQERHARSYDETGPNSRQAREDEFAAMGRRAGSRHAGAEDEGEDTGDAAERIETIAASIGLDPDLAAKIDPAAVGIVSDFAALSVDLALSDGQMAAISDWLEVELSGNAEAVDITPATLARQLGLAEADLGRMTPTDLQMAGRFLAAADDAGMSVQQILECVAWAGKAAKTIPEARGRGAGRGSDDTGGVYDPAEPPAVITKDQVARMSLRALRQMMSSNFALYERSGGPVRMRQLLARGE